MTVAELISALSDPTIDRNAPVVRAVVHNNTLERYREIEMISFDLAVRKIGILGGERLLPAHDDSDDASTFEVVVL